MFSINLKGAEPEWYGWPEGKPKEEQAQLLIRPYPMSRNKLKVRRSSDGPDDEFNMEIVKEGSDNKAIYMYCLMDAKGLTDQNGEKLVLNREITIEIDSYKKKMSVKEFIYDYQFHTQLPNFVLQKARIVEEEVKAEEKNSVSG